VAVMLRDELFDEWQSATAILY